MRFLKHPWRWLALGWAYIALIFYLSLTPSPPPIAEFEQGDKLKHLLAYGILMAYFGWLYTTRSVRIAHAALFCGMGVAMEYLQRWGGVRTFEVADMLANTLGVALGLLSLKFVPL